MKKCSVYVNAARMEPFGINVIEGMCAGLIPVVTENVGAKDVVQRLEPSLIVKTDPKRIAEKVIEIFGMSHIEKVALSKKAKKIGSGFNKKKGMAEFERSFWNIVKSFWKGNRHKSPHHIKII